MSILQNLKTNVKGHLVNAKGWRTERKIIVVESDDWGAVRLPEARLLKKLKNWGIKTENDPMLIYDALASDNDLERLFHLLGSIPVQSGSAPPVITANTIVANPDFGKIEADGFRSYQWEPFTETLKTYPAHEGAFELWKQGINNGLFKPQFHGREHLHVNRWMNGLQNRKSETARLFNEKIYAVCGSASTEKRKSYLAAYDWDTEGDREFTAEAIRDGLALFESIFGYHSKSAIAPNYVWSKDLEKVFADYGVKYLQGAVVQRSPQIGNGNHELIRHYMGEINSHNQRYLIRNCRFEPALDPAQDWVENCMKEIKTAFLWKKPAIIESHRVNFIGYINPANRNSNLKLLDKLLRKIVETWPNVEFMTSDQLGELMDETS